MKSCHPTFILYKKQEIKRFEKRRDSSKNMDIFEGVDEDTMKEIEELIKD